MKSIAKERNNPITKIYLRRYGKAKPCCSLMNRLEQLEVCSTAIGSEEDGNIQCGRTGTDLEESHGTLGIDTNRY